MSADQNTIGRIEGLLEAWNIDINNPKISLKKRGRILDLFKQLSPGWIVVQMMHGYPSTKKLLAFLSDLSNGLVTIIEEDNVD